jgi:hypothetical protein
MADHDGGEVAGWQVGSGNLPGVDEKAASSQPELLYGKEYYLFKIPHSSSFFVFVSQLKKNICSSFFDGTRVCLYSCR